MSVDTDQAAPLAVEPTPAMLPWTASFTTVCVTGTNGKTSTSYLAAAALRTAKRSVLTETTISYTLDEAALDVPRNLRGYIEAVALAAARGCRHAVIEATSYALYRGFARTWRCDIGVFTNLTHDHLHTHGSFEHYLASKAQLFMHLAEGGVAVLNAVDPAALLLDRVTPPGRRRIWYAAPSRGTRLRAADLAAREVVVSAAGTTAALEPSALAEELGYAIEIQLVGEVFVENALAAAAAALAAGASGAEVRAGLARCASVPGRFEILSRSPIVTVDYAHTPDALARTCETARRLSGEGRVIVVFGAGGGADRDKRVPMGEAVGARADLAIITSDNPRREPPEEIAAALAHGCRRGGRAQLCIELDRARAIEQALDEARPGDVVVIAGKGHEEGQLVGERRIPFSDLREARRLLGAR